MHEVSIAANIIDVATEEMARHDLKGLAAIGVRVGELTCVSPEALCFAFDSAVMGTRFSGVKLKIEQIPVKCECRSCASCFNVEKSVFACPLCGCTDVGIKCGNELDIAYLEEIEAEVCAE